MIAACLATMTWFLASTAAGAGILPRRLSGELSIAESFSVGAVLLSFVCFHLSLMGLPLGMPVLFFVLSAAFTCGIRPLRNQLAQTSFERFTVAELISVCVIAGSVLLVALQAFWEPLTSWDARTHWTYLAKLIYYEASIAPDILYEPAGTLAHHNYPLLLPISEWFVFTLQGSANDHSVRLVALVFYCALLLSLYRSMKNTAPRALSMTGIAIVASSPLLLLLRDGGASSGYADIPLALLMASFVALLGAWIRNPDEDSLLWLSAFMACGMIFTKREGMPLAGLCLLALTFTARREWRKAVRVVIWAALICLPWLIHWNSLPPAFHFQWPSNPDHILVGIQRIPWLIKAYLSDLFLNPKQWGLQIWLVGYLACRKQVHTSYEKTLLGIVLLNTAVHFAALMYSAVPPEEGNPTTRARIFFHAYPALAIYGILRATRR